MSEPSDALTALMEEPAAIGAYDKASGGEVWRGKCPFTLSSSHPHALPPSHPPSLSPSHPLTSLSSSQLPVMAASGLFTLDMATETFTLHSFQAQPVGGGQLIGSGYM